MCDVITLELTQLKKLQKSSIQLCCYVTVDGDYWLRDMVLQISKFKINYTFNIFQKSLCGEGSNISLNLAPQETV